MAMAMSQIVRDDRGLLLVRVGTQAPLLSISAGGEVRAIRLQFPEGYELRGIVPTASRLLGSFTRRRTDGAGSDFALFAFDRDTGKVEAQYTYPRQWGMSLPCSNGTEFSFLRPQDGKVMLLTATEDRVPAAR